MKASLQLTIEGATQVEANQARPVVVKREINLDSSTSFDSFKHIFTGVVTEDITTLLNDSFEAFVHETQRVVTAYQEEKAKKAAEEKAKKEAEEKAKKEAEEKAKKPAEKSTK